MKTKEIQRINSLKFMNMKSINSFIQLRKTALLLLLSLLTLITSFAQDAPVQWVNTSGVTTSTNPWTVTKTSGTAWGNAGASSYKQLLSDTDGSVYWIKDDENYSRVFGLSNQDVNAHLNTIEYAFMIDGNNQLSIRESGTIIGSYGSISPGDVLSIERSNGLIFYKKNGTTLYSNTTIDTRSLLVDIALYHHESTFQNIRSSFANELMVLETQLEEGVTFQVSGANVNTSFSAGTSTIIQPDWPPLGSGVSTLSLDLLENGEDMGYNVLIDLTAERTMVNSRLELSTAQGPMFIDILPIDLSIAENTNTWTLGVSGGELGVNYIDYAECPGEGDNFVTQILFDENGKRYVANKQYLDLLGRSVQTQSQDFENQNVLAVQSVFDSHGRAVLQSLPAPTDNTYICKKDNFLTNSVNAEYSFNHFDTPDLSSAISGTLNAPDKAYEYQHGTVGYYYSNNNAAESHVPATNHPFSRVEYWRDPLQRIKRVSGVGDHHQLGTDHESQFYYMGHAGELAYLYGNHTSHIEGFDQEIECFKTIAVDEEGSESVIYTDKAKRVIASCVSGKKAELDNNCLNQQVSKLISIDEEGKGFVDIHLPEVHNASLILDFLPPPYWSWNNGNYNLENQYSFIDLKTGFKLVSGTDYNIVTDPNIDPAARKVTFNHPFDKSSLFLRIRFQYDADYREYVEDDLYATASFPKNFYPDQLVNYQLDYVQWTLNYYDKAGQLIKTIPPEGIDCNFDPISYDSKEIKTGLEQFYFGVQNTPLNFPHTLHFDSNLPSIVTTNTNTNGQPIVMDRSLQIQINPFPRPIKLTDGCPDFSLGVNVDGTYLQEEHIPVLADKANLNAPIGTATINRTFVQHPLRKEVQMELDISKSKRSSSNFDDALPGGGNGEPVPFGCSNCEVCISDYWGTQWMYHAQKACGQMGKVVDRQNTTLETDANGTSYYCVSCKTPDPTSCIAQPYEFLVGFRIEIDVVKDGFTVLNDPNNTFNSDRYVYATLNYRYCEEEGTCDFQWDQNSFQGINNLVPGAFIQNPASISFRIKSVGVARVSPTYFAAFNPTNLRDEMLKFLDLRLTTTVHNFPAAGYQSPNHSMANEYDYDAVGRLVEMKTPDAGSSFMTYNAKGQLRFSQDKEQKEGNGGTTAANKRFSYFVYDRAGRMTETGEFNKDAAGSGGHYFQTAKLDLPIVSGSSVLTIVDDQDGLNPLFKEEQRHFEFDVAEASPSYLSTFPNYTQRNVMGRMAQSYNDHQKSWYSYDRYGRTEWVIRYFPDMDGGKYVSFDFEYLLTGEVTQVAYQKTVFDESFYHFYNYDANHRLETVKTGITADKAVADLQATYHYYLHGPLKRVELGEDVQGLDYIYTIQGMLKSINAATIDYRDPGADGYAGANSAFAKDIFGISLDYFSGDYQRAGTHLKSYNTEAQDNSGISDHFNGLLKGYRWKTNTESTNLESFGTPLTANNTRMYGFQYDGLYRMKEARYGIANDHGNSNNITFAASDNYHVSNLTYDRNGNIQSLRRTAYDFNNSTRDMDDFTYHYQEGTNKLVHVEDAVSNGNWTMDLDHVSGYNSNNPSTWNYRFDKSGRLKGEGAGAEEKYVDYNALGKVATIYTDDTKTIKKVSYTYNELGQKISRTTYEPGTNNPIATETFYVNGPSGLSAIYEKDHANSMPLELEEYPIYGTDKLGAYRPTGMRSIYELKDHLGNVRAAVSSKDKILAQHHFDGGTDGWVATSGANISQDNGRLKFETSHFYNGGYYSVNVTPGKSYQLEIDVFPDDGFTTGVVIYESQPFNILKGKNTSVDDHIVLNFIPTQNEVKIRVENKDNTNAPVVFHVDNMKLTQVEQGVKVLGYTDYYPFGMSMPGRSFAASPQYRYGYQGQETEGETGWSSFELRMYQPALGRWLSTDPYRQHHSPYLAMSNNPALFVDPDGGRDESRNKGGGEGEDDGNADKEDPSTINLQEFEVIDYATRKKQKRNNNEDHFNWLNPDFLGMHRSMRGGYTYQESSFLPGHYMSSEEIEKQFYEKAEKLKQTIGEARTKLKALMDRDYEKMISEAWDSDVTRMYIPDIFTIGVSGSAIVGTGGGTGVALNWVLHGEEASVFPIVTLIQEVGVGYDLDLNLDISSSSYLGEADDIERSFLETSIGNGDATYFVGGGFTAGVDVSIGVEYTPTEKGYGVISRGISVGIGVPAGPFPVNAAAGVSNTWILKDTKEYFE